MTKSAINGLLTEHIFHSNDWTCSHARLLAGTYRSAFAFVVFAEKSAVLIAFRSAFFCFLRSFAKENLHYWIILNRYNTLYPSTSHFFFWELLQLHRICFQFFVLCMARICYCCCRLALTNNMDLTFFIVKTKISFWITCNLFVKRTQRYTELWMWKCLLNCEFWLGHAFILCCLVLL